MGCPAVREKKGLTDSTDRVQVELTRKRHGHEDMRLLYTIAVEIVHGRYYFICFVLKSQECTVQKEILWQNLHKKERENEKKKLQMVNKVDSVCRADYRQRQ